MVKIDRMGVEEEHNHEMEILEFTTKMGGIILKKAELDKDFVGVYERVFAKILEEDVFDGRELLEILGDVGG
jgi:hypothetical protein